MFRPFLGSWVVRIAGRPYCGRNCRNSTEIQVVKCHRIRFKHPVRNKCIWRDDIAVATSHYHTGQNLSVLAAIFGEPSAETPCAPAVQTRRELVQ
jgi:hypothetical protein